ncbi:MAG: hypothetical protein JJE28_02525 [Actinomycetales bacterium]|nr:hypothetical protein [Actinomycetales bacterium]
MQILATVLVILHFIGLSFLLGSFLVQVKDIAKGKGRVLRGMIDGALLQLITGLALTGIYSAHLIEGEEVNNAKIAVKLVVLLVIVALVFIFRKREVAPSWVLWAIGGLTLLNVVLAVAWTGK